jgi:hypothetical protein
LGLEQLFSILTGDLWGWNNCFVNIQEIGGAGLVYLQKIGGARFPRTAVKYTYRRLVGLEQLTGGETAEAAELSCDPS